MFAYMGKEIRQNKKLSPSHRLTVIDLRRPSAECQRLATRLLAALARFGVTAGAAAAVAASRREPSRAWQQPGYDG